MHTSSAQSPAPTLPRGTRIAIVSSSYYRELIASMEDAARSMLREAGIPDEHIRTVSVPGSFEIPLACEKLAAAGETDGIIALGVIIQGESHHASEVARACTEGLMQVQLTRSIPIAHEVIFVDSFKIAKERCTGRDNKGTEAARSLARMLALFPPKKREE